MTGPEHFTRAEQLIEGLSVLDETDPTQARVARNNLLLAQVHATLALVSATAD